MSSRRVIDLYFDMTQKQIISDSLELFSEGPSPSISYKEEVVFRVRLYKIVDNAYVPYTEFGASDAFTASIDTDYDRTTPLLTKSFTTDFNLTEDWDEVDPTAGKICFRMSGDTLTARDRLSTSASLDSILEVQSIPSGETFLSSVLSFNITFLNLLDAVESETVDTADYNDTALSTTEIQMLTDLTSVIQVGAIVGVGLDGTMNYGTVASITATVLTVSGITLTLGAGDITALEYEVLPEDVESNYYTKSEVDALIAGTTSDEAAIKYSWAYG